MHTLSCGQSFSGVKYALARNPVGGCQICVVLARTYLRPTPILRMYMTLCPILAASIIPNYNNRHMYEFDMQIRKSELGIVVSGPNVICGLMYKLRDIEIRYIEINKSLFSAVRHAEPSLGQTRDTVTCVPSLGHGVCWGWESKRGTRPHWLQRMKR
jgi:hypothetical protein